MIIKKIFASVLFLLFADLAVAQDWVQTNGPGSAYIRSIAVNPKGYIFVASSALHRSTDGGKTWVQIFMNLPQGTIGKIISQRSGKLFALVDVNDFGDKTLSGIYSSDDNGNTWGKIIYRRNLWIGNNDHIFTLSLLGDTLEYSTNDGKTWVGTSFPQIQWVYDIASDTIGNIFLCSDFVYRSTDKGLSWEKLIYQLPQKPNEIANIWISPIGELFATKDKFSDENFIYRSIDLGNTWSIDTSALSFVHGISFGNDGNMFIAGSPLFFSANSGKDWKLIKFPKEINAASITCSAAEPSGSFLVGTEFDLLRFDPADSSLSRIILPNGRVTAIYNDNGRILAFSGQYASAPIGWESTDMGSSWKPYYLNFKYSVSSIVKDSSGELLAASGEYIVKLKDSTSSFISAPVTGIVVKYDGDIFVGVDYSCIFRSTDNAVTWENFTTGIRGRYTNSIALDKNGNVYATGTESISILKDKDSSWQEQSYNAPNLQTLVVTKDQNLIGSGLGTFRSSDKGVTWSELNTGMEHLTINNLMVAPNGTVFAATDSGVFRLDSGTNFWRSFSKGLTAKNILCLTYDSDGRLYVGSEVSGVFRSVETFKSTSLSGWIVADDMDFDTVAVGSEKCKDISIRNAGNAPFILNKDFIVKDMLPFSVDTVITSFPVSMLPNVTVKVRVCFHPPQPASYSSEIDWSTNLDPVNVPAMKHSSLLKGIAPILKNVADKVINPLDISLHPNPAAGNSITLSLSHAVSEHAAISLYDILGKELWKSSVTAGEKEFTIPLQNLPKGMYYVRIVSGETTITKEFIK